ncbi:cyclopropane-fatty-acyl-phospholipid synthase family protein [Mesorhizobium qingshengii]|uniref:Cyclopropane-fatty-acyl-phospholipid synthase family protein n=1 Tax=Mesorhizobium qingshengii TaxID=1165689 RepID=A0ABT4R298_9HYPH|nr:cyclopropane-fatty-acyl-phospholipid synthase family protein [Mesorhizobium qingshengii]MCZ8547956.1 cyclopropane-fatty-acyl-phospholipid synthase family protein [Mesorhizobium qingshengii]
MEQIILNERTVPSGRCDHGPATEDHVHEHHSTAGGQRSSSTLMSPDAAADGVCLPQAIVPRKQGAGASASTFLLRSLLRRIIRNGTLTLVTPDGCACDVGHGEPSVTIRITDQATVRRLFLNPDLALGEAYMAGTLVVEDGGIHDLLDLCFANLGWSTGHWVQRAQAIGRRLGRRLTQHNPVSISRANVAHHYDLSDLLYELFLDADRQYSCAYYMSPDDTLEQAQDQKKRHIAAKLLLRAGQRVLDIGSGWGGLALHLARNADVDVTGVTLSTEQHAYANRRAHNVGLNERVRYLLKDYRHENGRYERIVSVGMFEHVGVGHYGEYFAKIKDLLSDDGVALIHTIGSAAGPGAANPWIRKYIFPGGYTPALSEIVPAIERAGLHITDIEVLRLHYAETLKDWRKRFIANRDRIAAIYDERFCRMWEFYLAGCEAAFRHSGLVVFQIQLSKRVDTVPLTRDYIAEWERAQSLV